MPRCKAALVVLLLPGAQPSRVSAPAGVAVLPQRVSGDVNQTPPFVTGGGTNAAMTTDNPLMRYDGSKWAAGRGPGTKLTVTHQGVTIYSGTNLVFDFVEEYAHKEFVATLQSTTPSLSCDHGRSCKTPCCSIPVFVTGNKEQQQLCGATLFSQDSLMCDNLSEEDMLRSQRYGHLAPTVNRGFSVEFEFVGRGFNKNVWEQFKGQVATHLWSGDIRVRGQPVQFVDDFGNLSDWAKILTLQECFKNVIDLPSRLHQPCSSDLDCALSQFCMDCVKCAANASTNADLHAEPLTAAPHICAGCPQASGSYCMSRARCRDDLESDECPPDLARWNWERDASVAPLSLRQAEALGGDRSQIDGSPFEVTAPVPPNVLSGGRGMQAIAEMLTVLKHMGTQVGPSQGTHVHVNAGGDAPGKPLNFIAVAHVWAAWVKYQFVTDEMLAPNRVVNNYARPLAFGDCKIEEQQTNCGTNPCACIKRFFKQMHEAVNEGRFMNLRDFCNKALDLPAIRRPACATRYPTQRYFSLNLVPLWRYGTVEFRSHSASLDPERIGRWAQFLVAFVDHFGTDTHEVSDFFNSDWESDYKKLQSAQQTATTLSLFDALAGNIDSDTAAYYQTRRAEQDDPNCHASAAKGSYIPVGPTADCRLQQGVHDQVVQAIVYNTATNNDQQTRTLQVAPPFNTKVGDYINVQMPEGEIRTVKVPPHGVWRFTFEDNPKLEGREALLAHISASHRCCCSKNDETCLWFRLDRFSADGKCPRLAEKHNRWCALASACLLNRACWSGSHKWHHRPGHCEVLPQEAYPEAFFSGTLCSERKKA